MMKFYIPQMRTVAVFLFISSFFIYNIALGNQPTVQSLQKQIKNLEIKLKKYQKKDKEHDNGLSLHKENFILPLTYSSQATEQDREQQEIKFQISFKQRVFDFNFFQVFAAYTQKSFWQYYDLDDSRPFRETNYNPEFFLQTANMFSSQSNSFKILLGYEHESNGAREPTSRSWDRAYIQQKLRIGGFEYQHKLWYRIPEKNDDSSSDTTGDENPDILDYYGVNEVKLRYHFKNGGIISMTGRWNARQQQGGGQIDIGIPLYKTPMLIQLHYWNGYGESLIDYNKHITKVGIGIILRE